MTGWASVARFGAAALVGCAPFWVAGAVGGRMPAPLTALPWSALGVVVPATAAFVLARREGALADLRAQFVPRRAHPAWWVAAAAAAVAPTLLAQLRHGPWTPPAPGTLAVLALLYVAGALGEEIGWVGFLQPRLLRLTGSVPAASALAGAYWLAWHLVPYLQTGQPPAWIAAQSAQLLLTRALIVGLTTGSGGGVWLAAMVHALGNLAWGALPDGGVAYDPAVVDVMLLPLVGVAQWAACGNRA